LLRSALCAHVLGNMLPVAAGVHDDVTAMVPR
jgi:hypothetical protein